MKKYLSLALLTFISGILSVLASESGWMRIISSDFFITILPPGIVFGLILGIYFWKKEKVSLIKVIIWVVCSMVAFYLAVRTAVWLESINIEALIFIIAGAVGAMILALATTSLIKRLTLLQMMMVVLLGAAAGFVFGEIFKISSGGDLLFSFLAYIIWQMAVGISLGVFVDKNKLARP